MPGQQRRPPRKRRPARRQHHRLPAAMLGPGDVEVLQQNPPGHPVDGQMVNDQHQLAGLSHPQRAEHHPGGRVQPRPRPHHRLLAARLFAGFAAPTKLEQKGFGLAAGIVGLFVGMAKSCRMSKFDDKYKGDFKTPEQCEAFIFGVSANQRHRTSQPELVRSKMGFVDMAKSYACQNARRSSLPDGSGAGGLTHGRFFGDTPKLGIMEWIERLTSAGCKAEVNVAQPCDHRPALPNPRAHPESS